MLRQQLKTYIDQLSEEELQALAVLLGFTEDVQAAACESLQDEIRQAMEGKAETSPIGEVAARLGITHS